MSGASWLGLWLLALGGLAIAVEVAVLVPMIRRLSAGLAELQEAAESERQATMAEVELLLRERDLLRSSLEPYRRVLRVIRHPITAALIASYRRRRARR